MQLYFLTSLSESAGNDDIAKADTPCCPLEPVVYVRLCQCHQMFASFSIKRSVHNGQENASSRSPHDQVDNLQQVLDYDNIPKQE